LECLHVKAASPIQLQERVPFGFVDTSQAVDSYVQKRTDISSRQHWQLGEPQAWSNLWKNDVDIDIRTLSHHVNYLLECHEVLYNQMVVNVNRDEMHVVFNTINVTRAVRLVASFDLSAFWFKESFSIEWFPEYGHKMNGHAK
jgi:hypothetical protein